MNFDKFDFIILMAYTIHQFSLEGKDHWRWVTGVHSLWSHFSYTFSFWWDIQVMRWSLKVFLWVLDYKFHLNSLWFVIHFSSDFLSLNSVLHLGWLMKWNLERKREKNPKLKIQSWWWVPGSCGLVILWFSLLVSSCFLWTFLFLTVYLLLCIYLCLLWTLSTTIQIRPQFLFPFPFGF